MKLQKPLLNVLNLLANLLDRELHLHGQLSEGQAG